MLRCFHHSRSNGLWYGQEELGYPALLIPLECCNVNICAQFLNHTVAASLKALMATGRGEHKETYIGVHAAEDMPGALLNFIFYEIVHKCNFSSLQRHTSDTPHSSCFNNSNYTQVQ